jgi:SAM-dependent methyltransferase
MHIIPEFKNKTIASIMVNLVLLAVFVLVSKLIWTSVKKHEGFTQNEPFILKTGADVYDDFYAEAYDDIFLPDDYAKATVKAILNATGASDKSKFLDVGSGTGSIMKVLGSRCTGIEKSKPMVQKCKSKCGTDAKVVEDDVLDPLAFSRYQFSHILCLDKTIYELETNMPNGSATLHKFFGNCRMWLQNGGYLIVQLVNPQKFNAIVPASMPAFISNPQKYVSQRITKSEVDFGDHVYSAKYNNNAFVETFTDKASGKVRQNERALELQDEASIVKQAQMCGFSLHGQINMEPVNGDEHQSLYIFI